MKIVISSSQGVYTFLIRIIEINVCKAFSKGFVVNTDCEGEIARRRCMLYDGL